MSDNKQNEKYTNTTQQTAPKPGSLGAILQEAINKRKGK